MKTIQEKIAELEIRTSNLEKKSSFEGKKHLDEISEWIQSQPGVQIIKRKYELSKDIDWLLTKYRAVKLSNYYYVYSASNKANTLEIDFTRNPKNVTFVRLIYSKTTGDIEIIRKRRSIKPRGVVVNKTPQEVADLLYSGEGIEAWDMLLTRAWGRHNFVNNVLIRIYTEQFFKIMVQRLRKKKNPDIPLRMSAGFKEQVIEILIKTLPVSIKMNKTPQEVAALVIDWGIGDWYQSLNQTELIDTQDKKYRAMGLLAITYPKLRKKYNDLPKQMDNVFKKQVVEILVDKLPDVGDGRYLPGNKGKSKIKTYLDL